jgi:Na+/H+-dicarboxylate symporter
MLYAKIQMMIQQQIAPIIALILPIDHFCDMFRSATNVLGNALATSVVGKWEKE